MFDVLDRLLQVAPTPPIATIVGTAVVAAAVVLYRRSWRLCRNVVTIAHEGGHAVAALLSGRRLQGIRLHSDTSGLTFTSGRSSGPGMVFSLAAGYPAASLLGVGGAALLASGRITLLLWLCILLAVLMLVMIRNVFGVVSVVVTGAVLFGVSWFADARWQALFAYAAVWFLLIGGVRPVFEVQGQRRRGRGRTSDPDQLAGVTPVPAVLWVGFFLLIGVGSLVVGGWLLGVVTAPAGWPF
jgi:hypothetical protein